MSFSLEVQRDERQSTASPLPLVPIIECRRVGSAGLQRFNVQTFQRLIDVNQRSKIFQRFNVATFKLRNHFLVQEGS